MTSEERLRRVKRRTEQLRQKRQRRRQCALDALCLGVCLLLVTALGAVMPGWSARSSAGQGGGAPGTASLLTERAESGYILMGLLAFLLGVTVTVLLFRLRRRAERRNEEHGTEDDGQSGEMHDEL